MPRAYNPSNKDVGITQRKGVSKMREMNAPMVVRMPSERVEELKQIARRLAVERGRWIRLSDVVREALDQTYPPKPKEAGSTVAA